MAEPHTLSRGRSKRVLCVDDEPLMREALALHLRKLGCRVEVAADGIAALDVTADDPNRFDCVITDNQMPGIDGVEFAERLRHSGYRGALIFFSSTLPSRMSPRLEPLNVHAIVEKGRSVTELTAALQSALEQ